VIVEIVPPTAPFSAEQRAWLNGFLAGVLGLDGAPAAVALAGTPDAPAANVEPAAAAPADDHPWHDPVLALDERLRLAEGRALSLRLMAAMGQLDCGQCGYLCRTYADAIASGAEPELDRCAPGGRATARALRRLTAEATAAAAGGAGAALGGDGALASGVPAPAERPPATGAPRAPRNGAGGRSGTLPGGAATMAAVADGATRARPAAGRLVACERLSDPRSEKDVRHVAIEVAAGGVRYAAGDALGVFAENDPALVDEILRRLGASGEEPVTAAGESLPARRALRQRLDVRSPSDAALECLAAAAGSAAERAALAGLARDGLAEGVDLLDLLWGYPTARPSVVALARALGRLQPRLYSIASSSAVHPAEVHLTVAVVRYRRAGRLRGGVASTFFAERLALGAEVPVYVQPTREFRPPADGDTPVIMIGPGTGVAPFRAFLQERRARGHRGRNWLFFGNPHRDLDFLYRRELEAALAAGLLTRLDTAFSRDQPRKVYVQHRMREHGRALWAWLVEGACVYVCGDARRMAPDVHRALEAIAAEHGGRGAEGGAAFVRDLARQGRYLRDVY